MQKGCPCQWVHIQKGTFIYFDRPTRNKFIQKGIGYQTTMNNPLGNMTVQKLTHCVMRDIDRSRKVSD